MVKTEEREKNWYVFIQDKHQGPFPLAEILEKKLPAKEKIWLWKQGMADWKSLAEVEKQERSSAQKVSAENLSALFDEQDFAVKEEVKYSTKILTPEAFNSNLEIARKKDSSSGTFLRRKRFKPKAENCPPDLPIVIQPETKTQIKASEGIARKSRFSEVPPIPLNRDGIKLFEEKKEALLELSQDTAREKVSKKNSIWKKLLLVASIALIAYIGKLNWPRGPHFVKPRGMTAIDYKRMLKVAEIDPAQRVEVAFASSRDGKRLWMTTNLDWEGKASVLLRSIKGRVLSQTPLEFSSDAAFSEGLVEFNRFNILQGNGQVPGYYQVSISGVADFQDQTTKALYPLLNHQKNLFWGKVGINETNFAKRLETFQRYLGNKTTQHYDELLQNYATLLSLSNQAEFLLSHFGSKLKNKKTISQLEREYANTVGTVFGSMVMGTEKIYLEIKDRDFQMGEQYKKFQTTAKSFGEQVASTVEQMKILLKKGKPSSKQRSIISQNVKKQFAQIQTTIKEEKESIQTALIKLKMNL